MDTTNTTVPYATALDPRLYVHASEGRDVTRERSATETYCSYRRTASYWNATVGGALVSDLPDPAM